MNNEEENLIFEGNLSHILTEKVPENLIKHYGEDGAYIIATLQQMDEENKINNADNYDFHDFLETLGIGDGLDIINHLNIVIANDDTLGKKFFGMKSNDYGWTATNECDNFHNIYYNYCITHGQTPEEFITNYMTKSHIKQQQALTKFLEKTTNKEKNSRAK